MKKRRWFAWLAPVLVPVACGDGAPTPPPVPATIVVSPAEATLTAIDETVQFTARVADQNGNVLTGTPVAWGSATPSVVAVDPATGLATAAGAGTALISARAGSIAGRATATVRQVAGAIAKAEGDEQQGFAGEALSVSPSVLVSDANGHPARDVAVEFEVAAGGGSVSPGSALTGADGLARTRWTLGDDSAQALAASAGGFATTFRATAAPRRLAVVTDSLKQGRLTVSYAQTLVAVGGSQEGYAWSLAEGARLPRGLALEADGEIVGVPTEAGVSEFEVRVADSEGASASQALSLRVCDGPLGLETGDVQLKTGSETEPCGLFVRAPEAGAYYRVAVAGVSPGEGGVLPVELAVEAVSAGEGPRQAARRVRVRPPVLSPEWQELLEIQRANDALSRSIRRWEAEMYRQLAAEGRLKEVLDRGPAGRWAARPASARRVLNQSSPERRTFRLAQVLGEGGWDWNRCEVDRTVSARLVAENEHLAVYEDEAAAEPVSVANVNRILDYYADHGAEVIERWFGGVSDVNGDGRVVVVVDPLLDGVLAYVISNDMLKSQADCAASNEMELVHMSAGAFAQFDDGRYWALAGMVHEVKHVSSLYKRMRGWYRGRVGPTWHPVWAEEGTAEIAKEMSSRLAWESVGGPPADARLTGEMFRAGREEAYAEHYGVFGLMVRTVLAFSADPNAVTFEPWDEGQVYGSGWHFHRFLRDWFAGAGSSFADDQAFVTALNDSMAHSGAEGIERVVGEPISEILAAHAVAMTVAGAEASLTSDDTPRFTTVDFPTATEIFLSYPDPPGIYPWPVTMTGEDDESAVLAAPLAQSATFRGHMGESGLRVHDFRAEAAGAAAVFRVELPPQTRLVIARIPDPALRE